MTIGYHTSRVEFLNSQQFEGVRAIMRDMAVCDNICRSVMYNSYAVCFVPKTNCTWLVIKFSSVHSAFPYTCFYVDICRLFLPEEPLAHITTLWWLL